MNRTTANYNKTPFITINTNETVSWAGWEAICHTISNALLAIPSAKKIIALECYHGVLDEEIIPALTNCLSGEFYFTADYMLTEPAVQQLVYPDVTGDEVFGYITRLQLKDYFDSRKLAAIKKQLDATVQGNIFIYGPGASLLAATINLLVYFDMPRWEIQLRFRKNLISNLGLSNTTEKASLQYKQAFFVDWRVCDKHKKLLMRKWDFVVDTSIQHHPKMVTGSALHAAFQQTVTQPFRFVPFFDPGPWGGQWMKEHCDLDHNEKNYAWAFDCVPEENSLVYQFNGIFFETPGINLVFAQAKQLLGERVQARFGDEFPIRFDFLDTMDGGNLSLQVHPTTEYIREHFGMAYTQDESYYMLDAGQDACVYLGFNDNINPDDMLQELHHAQKNGGGFNAEKFAARWPVKKHDHVLIPAGTIHCSGKNSMVLEISATPYIFTFKLYDWGRMGLDGKPRPINIEHGKKVLNWSITPSYTCRELINTIEPIATGEGWREERTGLHEREFIETRRHWFTGTVSHNTTKSVEVLNLVEGREVIVESLTGEFEPFIVHYAETFVVPAAIKSYTIRPYGNSTGKQCATMKAYVR